MDGSEGRNGKCLGVEDHHDVQDGTKLIMWDCVDDAVGQEFTFDGDRLKYDGKCATWSKDRVVYGESCDHEKQHWKIIQL